VSPRVDQPVQRWKTTRQPARCTGPPEIPGYDFHDWPELTAGLTPDEAARLTAALTGGAQAAYKVATAGWPAAEHVARFDTAAEVEMAAMVVVRETAERDGRDPQKAVRHQWMQTLRASADATRQPPGSVAGVDPGRVESQMRELAAGLSSGAASTQGTARARQVIQGGVHARTAAAGPRQPGQQAKRQLEAG
jgi:hypothetical protein